MGTISSRRSFARSMYSYWPDQKIVYPGGSSTCSATSRRARSTQVPTSMPRRST